MQSLTDSCSCAEVYTLYLLLYSNIERYTAFCDMQSTHTAPETIPGTYHRHYQSSFCRRMKRIVAQTKMLVDIKRA